MIDIMKQLGVNIKLWVVEFGDSPVDCFEARSLPFLSWVNLDSTWILLARLMLVTDRLRSVIMLQMMLWHLNAQVNSHQRWKQTRFRICFHLWCELTNTMNVTEWQVSWYSCYPLIDEDIFPWSRSSFKFKLRHCIIKDIRLCVNS